MRLVAISIVILAGAVLVCAGSIYDASRQYGFSSAEAGGGVIVGCGCALFLIEYAITTVRSRTNSDPDGRANRDVE